MFNQIGGLNSVGGPLSDNQIGGESFIRHIGNDKLILDFHEGSGTVVHDKSHCGNNGTFKGVNEPAWLRNEVLFDGSNDYINCGNDSSLNILKAITIEVWVKPMVLNAFQVIISKQRDTSNSAISYGIRLQENNKFVGYNYTTSQIGTGDSTTVATTDKWYHIVITNDGTDFKIYVNGVYENGGTGGVMESNTTYSVYIGGWWTITTGIQYFNGFIGNIRIYLKALSQIEIQQEYLANKFRGNN